MTTESASLTLRRFGNLKQTAGSQIWAFGDLGSFPAEVIVEKIDEISIKPRPIYDYGKLLGRHD